MPLERSSPPTRAHPADADFALDIIVDRGTGYPADGADTLFYTAARVPDPETWLEVAQDIAGDDVLVSFTARAVWQGRYWELHDDAETTVVWVNRERRHG